LEESNPWIRAASNAAQLIGLASAPPSLSTIEVKAYYKSSRRRLRAKPFAYPDGFPWDMLIRLKT
jgi:hypothetical protein